MSPCERNDCPCTYRRPLLCPVCKKRETWRYFHTGATWLCRECDLIGEFTPEQNLAWRERINVALGRDRQWRPWQDNWDTS